MDSVFGIAGKDWAILGADASVMYSIMKLKVRSILVSCRRKMKIKFTNLAIKYSWPSLERLVTERDLPASFKGTSLGKPIRTDLSLTWKESLNSLGLSSLKLSEKVHFR